MGHQLCVFGGGGVLEVTRRVNMSFYCVSEYKRLRTKASDFEQRNYNVFLKVGARYFLSIHGVVKNRVMISVMSGLKHLGQSEYSSKNCCYITNLRKGQGFENTF
jgi:hypothetical protein